MTLEEAEKLNPGEYLVCNKEIVQYLGKRSSMEVAMRTVNARGGEVITYPQYCLLPGDYKGCFNQDVLPPVDPTDKEYSIEVLVKNPIGRKTLGWYNFQYKEWGFQTDIVDEVYGGVSIGEVFTWCFIPSYLK